MVYVTGDGRLVKEAPFSISRLFWGITNFFYLLIRTLINPNFKQDGDKNVTDYRQPMDGPPKPPAKRFSGFGPSGSGPPPPPMGGCGCGS